MSYLGKNKAQVLPFNDPRLTEDVPPKIMVKGEGCHVYDEAGNQYLEMMSGLWCAGLGFSNSAITEAVKKQMETLPFYHGFLGKASITSLELADRIAEMTPKGMNKVLFSNSGSEAVDTAVKLLAYYNNAKGKPGKKKIIVREGAYHGSGVLSGALTAMEYCHHGFDLSQDRILRTGSPNYYRCAKEGETEDEFAKRRALELDQLIESEGPENVAALFGEPVQASGGVIIPPDLYWSEMQKVLKKHDVFLVADEVVCGFHRTGTTFGCDRFDIQPDIMILAKQLSAGFAPISATVVTQSFYDVIADEAHRYGILGCGFTYSGHPVSAAASLATLDEYERLGFPNKVMEMESILSRELAKIADHKGVGNVRNVGLLGGVELDDIYCRKAVGISAAECAREVVRVAEENGVILRPAENVVAVCPPMIVSDEQLQEMLRVLDIALREIIH